MESSGFEGMIPIESRKVVDTTGAEDAFASDCIASRPRSADGCPARQACGASRRGQDGYVFRCGSRVVSVSHG
ncbi:MAG: hypothetical protein GX147_01000 [Deltaproteobacteria bacterium]|nr:hypothetical protein [Deltaproteobacteria bacterium]